MWYVWWGGGGVGAILLLWTLWNIFGARRRRNPTGDVLRAAVASLQRATARWREAVTNGDYYATLADGTMVTHSVRGMQDSVWVERGETKVSFIFLEGALIIVESNGAMCDSYHPDVRHNNAAARKLLNAIRRSRRLDTYDKEEGVYEADLRERKERASAHRTAVEEKLQRGKKHDDATEAGRKRKRG